MEEFEEAIDTTQMKPALWPRYVDDTFVLWRHVKDKLKPFLTYLNSRRPSIIFTMEIEEEG